MSLIIRYLCDSITLFTDMAYNSLL